MACMFFLCTSCNDRHGNEKDFHDSDVNADSISNSGTTYYIPFDRTLAEGTGINSITAGASGSTSAVSDAYVSGNTLVVVTGSELSDDQVIELPASAVVDASVSGNDNEAVTLTYSGGTWSAS